MSALDAGLDIYAATDHLSWGFSEGLIEAARQVEAESGRRLLVVPDIELRVTYRADEVHIAALFDAEQHDQRLGALLGILGLTSAHLAEDDLPAHTFEHDPVEVCRTVEALGGIACVAHADRAFGTYRLIDRPIFERLLEEPAVCAIDLIDPERYSGRLEGTGKACISCSDSHSCHRIGSRRAALEMEALTFGELRSALGRAAVREVYPVPTLNLV